jgi:hypothetical protein
MLACTAGSDGDGAEESDSALSASLIQNLGSIARGQTLTASYTSSPKYRSYSFTAAAGDVVDFWVRSSNGGDAYAYILRSSFSTVTSNHDAPGTKDAHVTAKIATAGTYYLVFRDEALHDATFTVEFNKPAVAVDAGAPDAPAASPDDPFDPNSCTGPLLTNPVSMFAPGATTAPLGRYKLIYRDRSCTELTGCTPWTPNVEASTVLQTGKYALLSFGMADNVKTVGRADLAVYPGGIRLHLTDDGAAAYADHAHVQHNLSNGMVLAQDWYGTTRYTDDNVHEIVISEWLQPMGGKRENGAWVQENTPLKLAGELREHCARLVATPSMKIPGVLYREVQVGAVLRW